MDNLDFWNLCDEFAVIQAVLLIIGEDPALMHQNVPQFESSKQHNGFDATFSAIKYAINSGQLKARIRMTKGHSEFYESPDLDTRETDWSLTTIQREDLVKWLLSKNYKPPFFFEQTSDIPPYLDPKNENYSPKLAAAVRVWEAVTTDPRYANNGKAPKTNIENWLISHADEFGLIKDDGGINNDAIKNQIAKVSNWKTDGGAPKSRT
jgi:hypothetical protein